MPTIGTGSPLLYVEGIATNVSGSGNTRTVKITAKLKVNGGSSSWYGYPCNWRAMVNGTYGSWVQFKDNSSWNGGQGLRVFEQTLTVDVGTSASKTINVGIYTNHPSYKYWNGNYNWNHTVGATNVPPVLSGTVTTNVTGTIPENTTAITVTSPAATDGNGNLTGYRCRVSINNGGYTEIYRGANRSYTHNISNYGEGTTFKYCYDCYDSANAWSGNVYSNVVTKNKFTGDALNVSTPILFATASLNATFTGASNTNGNTSFTRILSCDGLTVYNPTLTAASSSITIYRSGTVPTGCYVKFEDIKNKFKNSSYQGNLTFSLKTTNAYGTFKTSSKTVAVDLRTAPNGVTGQIISTAPAESTIYKKVASTNNSYFIPDNVGVARVKWNAGSGKLGESISYEVHVAYGSGSWQKVADVPSGTLFYNHKIPTQTISQQVKYMIRTKTSYGYYVDANTSIQTLHFYNQPGISIGTITRGATTAEIRVTVKSNSSIPNINTVGTWQNFNKGQTTPILESGSLTVAQTEQVINLVKLTDNGQFDLKITYNDDTGFAGANKTSLVTIGANSPIFFVNKYGAGIGGVKAEAGVALNMKGDLKVNGLTTRYQALGANINLNDIKTPGEYVQNNSASTSVALNYPEAKAGHLTVTMGAGTQQRYHVYNSSRIYTRAQYSSGNWTGWAKAFNSYNPPTPADVGATISTEPNKIVQRDAAGDVRCRLLRSEYQSQRYMDDGTDDIAMAFRLNNSTDNYVRFCNSKASIRNWLDVNPTVLGGTGGNTYMSYPYDGRLRTTTPAYTGYLAVTLPQSWTNTMLRFTIDIFDYRTHCSASYTVSGYTYAVNSAWVNVSAYAVSHSGGDKKNLPVRFGHDGKKCVVYIGESNTAWRYPQITIKDLTIGYSNYELEKWKGGWGIHFPSSLGTISATVTNTSAALSLMEAENGLQGAQTKPAVNANNKLERVCKELEQEKENNRILAEELKAIKEHLGLS